MRPLPAAYYEHVKSHPPLTSERAAAIGMTFVEPKEREPAGPRVVERPRPAAAKPQPRPTRFEFASPPCAYLGAETGEPIKISCGGTWKRACECHHPDRPQWYNWRSHKFRPNLAAPDWWCTDLGPLVKPFPRMYQACQTCPLRTPQLLLPAPRADRSEAQGRGEGEHR